MLASSLAAIWTVLGRIQAEPSVGRGISLTSQVGKN